MYAIILFSVHEYSLLEIIGWKATRWNVIKWHKFQRYITDLLPYLCLVLWTWFSVRDICHSCYLLLSREFSLVKIYHLDFLYHLDICHKYIPSSSRFFFWLKISFLSPKASSFTRFFVPPMLGHMKFDSVISIIIGWLIRRLGLDTTKENFHPNLLLN